MCYHGNQIVMVTTHLATALHFALLFRHNKDAPPLSDGGGGGGDPGGGSHEEDSEEELIRREQEEMGEDGWVGVGMEDLSEDFASTSIDQLPGNTSKQE